MENIGAAINQNDRLRLTRSHFEPLEVEVGIVENQQEVDRQIIVVKRMEIPVNGVSLSSDERGLARFAAAKGRKAVGKQKVFVCKYGSLGPEESGVKNHEKRDKNYERNNKR
jgi:hypothetical protein